jgi:hypothetical protein
MSAAQKRKLRTLEEEKALWYKKLKDEGFKDIEHPVKDTLKSWSNQFTSKQSRNSWRAKQEYYYMATHFLNDYKFNSKLEQIVWEYHSNGLSSRQISRVLTAAKVSTLKKSAVFNIIQRLQKLMKFMYMRPTQEQEQ